MAQQPQLPAGGGAAAARYRFNARSAFLTYPQCGLTKDDVLRQLRALVGDRLVWAIVAQEQHQDGTPHLHAVLRFDRLYDRHICTWADLTGPDDNHYHGNYQPCRNVKQSVTYILKDNNYCTYPTDLNVQEITAQGKKRASHTVVADKLLQGKGYDDIVADHSGFAMMHKKVIKEFEQYVHMKKARSLILPWTPITLEQFVSLNYGEQLVATWLNANLGTARAFKQKQLWLGGPAGLGKSSLAIELGRCQLTYEMGNEKYINDYDDDVDLILFEEVANQHTLTFLNRFIQGGLPMPIPLKGGSTMKNNNQPIMFLSNLAPEQAFPKAAGGASFAAFKTRIEDVFINDTLFTLIDIIKANNNNHEQANAAIAALAEAAHVAEIDQPDGLPQPPPPPLVPLPHAQLNALEGDDDDDDDDEIVAAGLGDHAYDSDLQPDGDIYDADTQSWSPGDFDADKDADTFISRINTWLRHDQE